MLATEQLMRNLFGVDYIKTINASQLDSLLQAQALEKEQIRDAFNAGDLCSSDYFIPSIESMDESEIYYVNNYLENTK